MRTCRIQWILLLSLLILAGCERAEPELLSGDIAGLVRVYNENNYLEEDMSGVQVHLSGEAFDAQSTTGPSGRFTFEEVDYGNYLVDLEKEGYFTTYLDYPLHHLGGYSPTLVRYSMYEIPKFETFIDSIRYSGSYSRYYIYVTLQGLSGLPRFSYDYWCFFSNTPEVSKDQYVADEIGSIWYNQIDGQMGRILVEIYDDRYEELKSDTIFCCVYPRAMGGDMYDLLPESLGKASNIFSYLHNSITVIPGRR